MIESWVVGLVCNTVIMVAYLLISIAIIVPLWRSHQLRSNPLGAATAAIFLSCAVHHGAHSVHMLMPTFGVDAAAGYAMRTAWGWPLGISDVAGALVGLWYWSLRRTYASLMQGAQLFEDLRRREQQALELNDTVLQGMVVAKMALDLDDPRKAQDALEVSIDSASRIITDLLGSEHFDVAMTRAAPADLAGTAPTPAPPTPGAADGRPTT